MKNIFTYILIFVTIGMFSSCNKWLNITPEDTTTENALFEDAGGYHSAINGLYQIMASNNLYGKNLTWGYLSALSQYYDDNDVSKLRAYYYTEKYDYNTNEVKNYGEQIWKTAYNVIANSNNILKHIKTAKSYIFPLYEQGEPQLIEGEALAIRGLLHFDLLRLFAQAPHVNPDAIGIPYKTDFPEIFPKVYTVKEVLKKVEEDLTKADSLLARCDTLKGGVTYDRLSYSSGKFDASNSGNGLFFSARVLRLNYVGVKALLARVYAYEGNMNKAYECANFIYKRYFKNNTFSYFNDFADTDDMDSRPHKLLSEILFGVYQEHIGNTYKSNVYKDTKSNDYALKDIDNIFDDKNDTRLTKLTVYAKQKLQISIKFLDRNVGGDAPSSNGNGIIPIIRMSEINLIRAEYLANHDQLTDAIEILQNLRTARKCTTKPIDKKSTKEQILELIRQESRRENIAEGQYFFFCKRLNKPTIYNQGVYIPMKGKYTMPIPDSENVSN